MFTVKGFDGKIFSSPDAKNAFEERKDIDDAFRELLNTQPEITRAKSGLYQLIHIYRDEVENSTVFEVKGAVLVSHNLDDHDYPLKKRAINFLRTGTY